jgi:hypothetical protein
MEGELTIDNTSGDINGVSPELYNEYVNKLPDGPKGLTKKAGDKLRALTLRMRKHANSELDKMREEIIRDQLKEALLIEKRNAKAAAAALRAKAAAEERKNIREQKAKLKKEEKEKAEKIATDKMIEKMDKGPKENLAREVAKRAEWALRGNPCLTVKTVTSTARPITPLADNPHTNAESVLVTVEPPESIGKRSSRTQRRGKSSKAKQVGQVSQATLSAVAEETDRMEGAVATKPIRQAGSRMRLAVLFGSHHGTVNWQNHDKVGPPFGEHRRSAGVEVHEG